MTRRLSIDLRCRVIVAIEGGVSTRETARRSQTHAHKQGQPSRSQLDDHEAFTPGLIEDAPDITLAEMGGHLVAERGVPEPVTNSCPSPPIA